MFPEDPDICRYACRAIWMLDHDECNRKRIIDAGGYETVVKARDHNPDDNEDIRLAVEILQDDERQEPPSKRQCIY